MSVVGDILATYGRPRRVIRRIIAAGPREDRALALVMAACAVVFVAQWPRLARQAHLTGEELNPLLGGALLAWLFVMPLALYTLALLSHWVLKLLGGHGGPHAARIALFWALLCSTPLMLLWGLVAGFIGPGPGLSAVGALWLAIFLWFWLSGLAEAWRQT